MTPRITLTTNPAHLAHVRRVREVLGIRCADDWRVMRAELRGGGR